MKLKSYFAGTVEAAVEQARQELGPDAVLVDTRKAPKEAKHLGEYEVVFALMPVREATGELPASNAGFTAASVPGEPLLREFTALRRQVDEIRKAIWRSARNASSRELSSSRLSDMTAALMEAEVDPRLAQEIAACVEARLQGDPLLGVPQPEGEPGAACEIGDASAEPRDSAVGDSGARVEQAFVAELSSRLLVDPVLGRPGGEPRVVALVGPPGAGKTTTLVKLAIAYGLTGRRPVQLLSLDNYRVAAAEQLRTYAAILGVGFQVLETGWALVQAIEEHRRKQLILVDTPGYSPAGIESAAELAAFISGHPEIDTHLVLAASTKSADLSSAVDRFEIFRPSKLLFTKVDETCSLGLVFSEAVRTGKPVSFLATGQQIPEDLEAATKERIIGRILQDWPAPVLSAA